MQKYYFQAVTAEGKEISGYVSATDIESARTHLKDGGLSILTLDERNVKKSGIEGMVVFDFEAINKEHVAVKGTIEAKEAYEAYKKLRLEYEFNVSYLGMHELSEVEKEVVREEGIDPEWETRLEIEKKKLAEDNEEKESTDDELKNVVADHELESSFMREKIEAVLAEIIPLLEENADYIDTIKKREIEEQISLLQRLKQSNSVDHLKHLTEKVLNSVQDSELFLKNADMPPEVLAEIQRREQQFTGLGKRFDKAITKGLIDIQVKLAGIDTKKIQAMVKDIHPINKIGYTLYWMFTSLLVFCLGFLGIMGIKFVSGSEVEKALFYLSSELILFFAGFSLITVLVFGLLFFSKGSKISYKVTVGSVWIIGILAFILEFPVIFPWTQSFAG